MSPHAGLLAHLRSRLDDTLRPLLAPARSIALLDFPSYANVGDSAIWLGALHTMRRLGLRAPSYTCDIATYDRDALARRIGDGTIVLTGGGNFGDLWERHQLFRERVIADFPGNPIVMLPQSVHFREAANLARAREVFDRHPRLTLLLRDTESHAMALREFRATSLLAPDMAFGLPALRAGWRPEVDVLWLKRADKEDLWADAHPAGPVAGHADWAEEDPPLLVRLHDSLVRSRFARPPMPGLVRSALSRAYPVMAMGRLRRGIRLIGNARVVVTDRLHGHILCMLLGLPHVVLDNNYGKLGRFVGTWTHPSPLARLAPTPDAAFELATQALNAPRAAPT